MIAITGANGQLGRKVIQGLIESGVSTDKLIAVVRTPTKAADLEKLGVDVRPGDYDRPESLIKAFEGAKRILLISSSEVGKRVAQHQAVIVAARHHQVQQLVYTSILKADESPLMLAQEHRETEKLIQRSGLAFTILRNGWYTENYLMGLPAILAHNTLIGAAQEGRFSTAVRADYAEAAVKVLQREIEAERIYELAGSQSFSLRELAAFIASKTAKEIIYQNLTPVQFSAALTAAGLPLELAQTLADAEEKAASGWLYSENRDLERLLGRPTTDWKETVAAALEGK